MKKAFTLIELLVVIAIIAILAAILFPVFAQAKLAAKKTVSLSNVKELGTATMMYMGDADDNYPQSEASSNGGTYMSWCTFVYPYIKNGDMKTNTATGIAQSYGSDGIFRSPGNPMPIVAGTNSYGAFSYGVHHSIFVENYGSTYTNANPSVNASVIDAPADKIIMMEKGANNGNGSGPYNYPWFMDWQQQWVGAICKTSGDPSTIYRDGVDVYTPGTSVYSPVFDSDCTSSTGGAWECAAHARYRYTQTAPMAFADGHAKAIKKGAVKWFQNIWVDRRNINRAAGQYGYMNDGGWGFPGIH